VYVAYIVCANVVNPRIACGPPPPRAFSLPPPPLPLQAMYVTRLHSTFYTLGFLIMTVKYFLSGPPDKADKPRQRARLMYGYAVTLLALVIPVLVSPQNFCLPVWRVPLSGESIHCNKPPPKPKTQNCP